MTGGRDYRENRGQRGTGGGGMGDFQGAGNWETLRKVSKQSIKFSIKIEKRGGSHYGRCRRLWELGVKGNGRFMFRPPIYPLKLV